MPTGQRLGAADVAGIPLPDFARAWLMIAADAAGRAPQQQQRRADLAAGGKILGVHLQIDAEGRAIVLADGVERFRIAEAAHVFGERLLAEELQALRGLGELL